MNKLFIVGFILAVMSWAHHNDAQAGEYTHHNSAPVASVAMGYKLRGHPVYMDKDYCVQTRPVSDVIQTSCASGGRSPTVVIDLGWEWRVSEYAIIGIGYMHQSQLLEGAPFNDNTEFSADQAYIRLRIGGVR